MHAQVKWLVLDKSISNVYYMLTCMMQDSLYIAACPSGKASVKELHPPYARICDRIGLIMHSPLRS